MTKRTRRDAATPWFRRESAAPTNASARVDFVVLSPRPPAVRWDDAWTEALRQMSEASARKDDIAATNDGIGRLLLEKDRFAYKSTTRAESPKLFEGIQEGLRLASMGGKAMLEVSDNELETIRSASVLHALHYEGAPLPHQAQLALLVRLAGATSRLSQGVVFDRVTVSFHGLGPWQRRVATAKMEVSDHIVLHFVREEAEDAGWVHSHGLCKFGLPELEIRGLPSAAAEAAAALLNEAGQELIDKGRAIVRTISRFGPRLTEWQFVPAEDPEHHFVGPAFRLVAPGDNPRRPRRTAENLLEYASGDERDEIRFSQTGDSEMEAAHARALQTLPMVKARFEKSKTSSSDDGTFMIKVGFPARGGGREFMWIEVTGWRGDRISGVLVSTPEQATSLRYGQALVLEETDTYDWTILKKDGSSEGAFTDEVLTKRARG